MIHWTEEILQRMNWVYYLTHYRKDKIMAKFSPYTQGERLYGNITDAEVSPRKRIAPVKAEWLENAIKRIDEESFSYPQWTSNCCNARVIEGTDICSKCKEGCEPVCVEKEVVK